MLYWCRLLKGEDTSPEKILEDWERSKNFFLPVPLIDILKILPEGPESKNLRKELISNLMSDLQNLHLSYSRFAVDLDYFDEVLDSNKILPENYKKDLRKIADAKKKLVEQADLKIQPQNLPDLCFPIVLRKGKCKSVVWGIIEPCDENSEIESKLCKQPQGVLVEKTLQKTLESNPKITFSCQIVDKFGLDIVGESYGLAAWTTLWLKITGLNLSEKACITGRIDEDGNILSIDDSVLKIKAALASGFSNVIVPAENLEEEAKAFALDPRVKGFSRLCDLREWLARHQPEIIAKEKIFSSAIGVISFDFDKNLFSFLFEKEARAINLQQYFQAVKRAWKQSARPKASNRFFNILKYAFCEPGNSFLGNGKEIDRKVWFGIFQFLVSDSIMLMHAPLVLECFRYAEAPLAWNLYSNIGNRFADHDLNLVTALEWGQHIFYGKETSPWQKEFRDSFPFLSWFLFSDMLVAIKTMLLWKDWTKREESWLNNIIHLLKQRNAEKISTVEFCWEEFSKEVLNKVARKDNFDFIPYNPNTTKFTDRPFLLVEIVTLGRKKLTEAQLGIFVKILKAHLNEVCNNYKIDAKETVADIIENIDNQGRISSEMENKFYSIKFKDPDFLFKALNRLITCSVPVENTKDCWQNIFKKLIYDSISSEQKESSDANLSRTKLNIVDEYLTPALKGFLDLRLAEDENNAGLAFQILANPAWVLFLIALDYQDKKNVNEITKKVEIWLDFTKNTLKMNNGFRHKLISKSIYYFAGRLLSYSFLPEDISETSMAKHVSFWVGFLENENVNNEKYQPTIKKIIKKAFKKLYLGDLLWLVKLSDKDLQDFVAECAEEKFENDSPGSKLNQELAKTIISCLGIAWNRKIDIKHTQYLLDEILENPDKKYEKKDVRQGVFSIVMSWCENFDYKDISRVCLYMAYSKGFSPLCFCLLNKLDPKPKDFLFNTRLWQFDWEKELYFTFLVCRFFLEGRKADLKNLLRHDELDIKNSILIKKIL